MSMNKKILFLFIISLFSFYIVHAEEIDNTDMTNQEEIIKTDEKKEEVLPSDAEEVLTTGTNINEQVNQYQLVIEDDAHLLTEEEITQLRDKMTSLTKYGHIIFKSISENTTSADQFARSYYHNNFSTDSGTLFLIDMDNRKIYIFSDGANYQHITDSKALSITDNIYRYASNGDYYQCAYQAFDQIQTILEGGKIAEPMRYTSYFFIAFVLSFFINFLIVLSSARMKKANKNEISKGCNIDFKIGQVHAIKTGTRRVYNPPSDSGGGSSGGGGGGGSSGGGGGHSF